MKFKQLASESGTHPVGRDVGGSTRCGACRIDARCTRAFGLHVACDRHADAERDPAAATEIAAMPLASSPVVPTEPCTVTSTRPPSPVVALLAALMPFERAPPVETSPAISTETSPLVVPPADATSTPVASSPMVKTLDNADATTPPAPCSADQLLPKMPADRLPALDTSPPAVTATPLLSAVSLVDCASSTFASSPIVAAKPAAATLT